MSKKKGLNLDTQKIVSWCKSNIVLVILIAVSIGAIVGLPQLGASWEEQVLDTLRQRSKNFTKIEALAKTSVTPPGSTTTSHVAVNQALVDEYTAVSSSLRGDAERVVVQAVEMNQKDYAVLFTDSPNNLFPNPSRSQMETLPQQYYQQLETDYKSLLQVVGAGSPISQGDLASYLEDARVRFMETNLSTKHDASLTKEQRESLEKHLSKLRMLRLRTNAQDMSVYLNESTLRIPEFNHKNSQLIESLFGWQWRYWVIADTVGSIAAINKGQSVLTSPIKRVVSIGVIGLPAVEDDIDDDVRGGRGGGSVPPPDMGGFGSPGDSGGAPRGGPMGGPMGGPTGGGGDAGGRGGGDAGGRGGGDSGGSSGTPKGDIKPGESFTGRVSGDMFDLITIRLKCIVDTQRIPEILDGFAQYNFLTVIDLNLRPADKFDALSEGFDYGPASVSELTVVLESVWLRSWTTEFMPDSVKKILGIQVDEK